jgi:hypothetical protein
LRSSLHPEVAANSPCQTLVLTADDPPTSF